MKGHKQLSFLAILALLVAGYVVASPAARAADTPADHSEEVSGLLSTAETEALELKHDAAQMESFARSSGLTWKSHAQQINMIKQHVNKVGELLTKLSAARETAAPWQQKAIDQIEPLLKQLAANTEATINHLNERKSGVQGSTYRDYALANYHAAEKLAALISDFVDYDEAMENLDTLGQKLVIAER